MDVWADRCTAISTGLCVPITIAPDTPLLPAAAHLHSTGLPQRSTSPRSCTSAQGHRSGHQHTRNSLKERTDRSSTGGQQHSSDQRRSSPQPHNRCCLGWHIVDQQSRWCCHMLMSPSPHTAPADRPLQPRCCSRCPHRLAWRGCSSDLHAASQSYHRKAKII
jgi:hypothetical protein